MRQPWETPLSGVPVTLDGGDSVVTDADGRYTFANVVTGTHTLDVNLPDGLAGDGELPQQITPSICTGCSPPGQ